MVKSSSTCLITQKKKKKILFYVVFEWRSFIIQQFRKWPTVKLFRELIFFYHCSPCYLNNQTDREWRQMKKRVRKLQLDFVIFFTINHIVSFDKNAWDCPREIYSFPVGFLQPLNLKAIRGTAFEFSSCVDLGGWEWILESTLILYCNSLSIIFTQKNKISGWHANIFLSNPQHDGIQDPFKRKPQVTCLGEASWTSSETCKMYW